MIIVPGFVPGKSRRCGNGAGPGPLAWIVPALTVAVVTVSAAQFDKRPAYWPVWVTLIACATILNVVAILRMRRGRDRKC